MLRYVKAMRDGAETSRRQFDQLQEFKRQLADRLLAWHMRAAVEAERRCERINATIARGARKCFGRH
jgi:hypothetical protein